MATLFSILAVLCAGNAVFVARLAGRACVDAAACRALGSQAHVILLCGALCLIAARYAR